MEQRNEALTDTVQNLRIEISRLKQEKVQLIFDSAQRIAEVISKTTPPLWKDLSQEDMEEEIED